MTTPTPAPAPPAGLRERVLAASLGTRPAGRATPEPEPISAVETFHRAADALGALLAALTDEQWRRPALRGLTVQGLIGHLLGVEADVQRALAHDAGVANTDHVASTQACADGERDRRPGATFATWTAAVSRSLDLLADATPTDYVAVHGLRLTPDTLCVVRAFELWTHENDIRRALGLPASEPDASTLTWMTRLAVRLLPRAAAGADLPDAVVLRLVLTGPGGGTWEIPLRDGGSPATAVGVVTDAISFCRLVANRLTPPELDTHVTGDPKVVSTVLRAATTLALD